MADEGPKFTIEFYEDDSGNEPALEFMRSLSPVKKRAIGVALNEVLEYEGAAVADGNMGKNLGGGLYEFRLDQNAEQILRRKGKDAKAEPEDKILIRVFFHPHGDRLLLLLSGYDKGERPSKTHQNSEIKAARALLKHWQERQKRAAAAAKKAPKKRG